MRESISRLEPGLAFTEIAPADAAIASAMSEQRALAKLSSIVAVLALLLAASGVWAMMSYIVSERTREFGIRLALGAPARSVIASVVRRAAITAAIGTAVGLVAYWPASRWLAARLYEISAVDPLTLGAASAVLLAVAIAAASLPARRATRVDPVRALRAE
jgi:ABC-type antimicrobial peptide transport system permease subunit